MSERAKDDGDIEQKAAEGEKRCRDCGNITDLHNHSGCPECGGESFVINEGGVFGGV